MFLGQLLRERAGGGEGGLPGHQMLYEGHSCVHAAQVQRVQISLPAPSLKVTWIGSVSTNRGEGKHTTPE